MNTLFENIARYCTSIRCGVIVMTLLTLYASSCSTGIESTKTIKMNKDDLKSMSKTPEQTFATSTHGTPLESWKKGKEFMAMSDRTILIFDPAGSDDYHDHPDLTGKTLSYLGTEQRTTPDLKEECLILFSDGRRTLRYPTGKTPEKAAKEIDSSKLPLLSDTDLIKEWQDKIKGMKLWTRSDLWYDETGNRVSGMKYYEVTVVDVIPTTGTFPMKVKISDNDNHTSYMQMNYTSDAPDSRNFAALFFLSNPQKRYPQITPENWMLIQQGKVALGMTKEECKLSLGNPDELRAGHSQSQVMDIWQYSNGRYLMFTDGLLTSFRL